MLIVDVDGVLTDGGIIMDEKGKEFKCFSVRDGTGATLWRRAGLKIGIISGRKTKVVEHRAKEIGAVFVYQNALKKLIPYNEIKTRYCLSDKEIAYVGDDLHDIPIMKRAGLSIAVADASPEVLPFAHLVTERGGGKGAVREAIELILKAKGLWDKVTKRYYE
jgi:3-deoxy-D-manno-octulosonate 8-phosphate phosphatase (KDO 8-P phosphatase)